MKNKVYVMITCCDKCPYERYTYSLNAGDTRFQCGKNKNDEWKFSGRDIPDHCPILLGHDDDD